MVDKALIIIGVVVIALLLVVAVLTINSGKSTQPQGNLTQTSISAIQSTPSTIPLTTTIPPATPANASVSMLFMNQSEVTSLIGPGGSYGAYSTTITPAMQAALPPEAQAFNITKEYNMTYIITGNMSDKALSEFIFPTKQAAKFYSYVLAEDPYFNTTVIQAQGDIPINSISNATVPGFVYSTSALGSNSSSSTRLTFLILAGHTNSSVALIEILEANTSSIINTTQLAEYTSQHLNQAGS